MITAASATAVVLPQQARVSTTAVAAPSSFTSQSSFLSARRMSADFLSPPASESVAKLPRRALPAYTLSTEKDGSESGSRRSGVSGGFKSGGGRGEHHFGQQAGEAPWAAMAAVVQSE
jgi:uncharacterized membrane protein YgcG